jgi:hypothetical protein
MWLSLRLGARRFCWCWGGVALGILENGFRVHSRKRAAGFLSVLIRGAIVGPQFHFGIPEMVSSPFLLTFPLGTR